MTPVRVAFVTNIPAPYRVPVLDRLSRVAGIDLTVFYAARTEPDRQWDLPPLPYRHVFLDGKMVSRAGRFIHHNPAIWGELLRLSPDVVVTTGYNPTHLLAYFYTLLYGKRHVVMTDGTVDSEQGLSLLHRLIRTHIIGRSAAGVAASHGGWRLLRSYGMPSARLHISPLCANPDADWQSTADSPRDLDLLFSGRLVPVKNADFALRVADRLAQRLGRVVRMAVLGDGPLLGELQAQAAALRPSVQVEFAGHVAQHALPGWFGRARLFIFPTRWDPWGVVANEAMEAGTPVLVSPHAGVAEDLVCDGRNGRVLTLDEPRWVDAAAALLQAPAAWQEMAANSRQTVAAYRADAAAAGLADAVLQAGGRAGAVRHSTFVRRPRVVCVQHRLLNYRVALFEGLRQRLAEDGIEFVLVHGQPTLAEATENNSGQLDWARHAPDRDLLGGRFVWQPPGRSALGADLVIVAQEKKQLWNAVAMTLQRPARLAYWGHESDCKSARSKGLRERVTLWQIPTVDWWFADTERSADLVTEAGFPADRVTTLENAFDPHSLTVQCLGIALAETQSFLSGLGIEPGAPVGIFIGSLTPDKRIGFLLETAKTIRQRVPGFRLLVVGSGPLADEVHAAAARHPWVHALGMRTGRDKALCLRSAQLMLNPGLVGLSLLDSFVGGVPIVTTDCHVHSTEVVYLRSGVNGVMTQDTPGAFVDACARLLGSPEERARLAAAALADASRYNIENMVERFATGISAALRLPGR